MPMPKSHILLTVAYDGTGYAGWQRQTNALAVQQVLEETLAKLMGTPVILRSASRTDAGVHALGQRAAFHTEGALKIPLEKFPQVVNGCLPAGISVTKAEEVPADFNPRHAKYKTYRYQFYNAPCPNPLIIRYSAFVPQKLDTEAMKECAAFFVGRHDFKSFCAAGSEQANISTVREIFACSVSRDGPLITLTVTGGGFLYNMVRIIAGTVWYAGLGKLAPVDVLDILHAKDRARAGKTMPPEGLTLLEVVY